MIRAFLFVLGLLTAATTAAPPEMTSLPGSPDVSTATSYHWSVALGDEVYFDANDGCYGDELWKTDVLTGETSLVKDIFPGATGGRPGFSPGFPSNLPLFKGFFYFNASSPATSNIPGSPTVSNSLWRSDGTTEGTVPFFDFSPSGPTDCLVAGDTLYIKVYTPEGKYQLWKTGGTPQSTVLVLPAGSAVPDFSATAVLGNLLVYPFTNPQQSPKLWRCDGTAAGTVSFGNVTPGTGGGNPVRPVRAGNKLYFQGISPADFRPKLWVTDGTTNGTTQVPYNDGVPVDLVAFKNQAVFNFSSTGAPSVLNITDGTAAGTKTLRSFSTDARYSLQLLAATDAFTLMVFYSTDASLWKTDGTVAGTVKVKSLGSVDTGISRPFVAGGKVYMDVQTTQTGKELWVTDGTANGTAMVKDILPGAQSSEPWPLLESHGLLFFSANDGVHGTELWKTDGTAAGTSMVRDLEWTSSKQRPSNMTGLGNNLLFCATTPATGRELWKYDAGTGQAELVKDLLTGTASGFYVDESQQFTVSGPYLYISADSGAPSNLWRTDGSAVGTVLLQNTSGIPNNANYNFLVPYNGGLLFPRNNELWRTDGTPATTLKLGAADTYPFLALLPPSTIVYTTSIGSSRSVLYRSNGTAAGTGPVGVAGLTVESNNWVQGMNGQAYVIGRGASGGTQLWKTDGTAAGTTLVKDLTGVAGSSAALLNVNAGNRLFFIKHPTQQTSELWSSDGTPNGTIKLSTLVHENFSPVHNLTTLGDVLYYTTGPQTSTELWRSDGTPAGTFLLRKFTENLYSPVIVLSTLGSRILMAVTTKAQGVEPWVTDGTAAGTKPLADIMPGAGSSDPVFLGKYGTLGYFAATDPTHGREIWVTDGEPAGTRLVEDFSPGMDSSFPFWVGHAGTHLLAMFEKDPASGGVGLLEIAPEISVLEGTAPLLTEFTDGQEAPLDFGMVRQTRPQTKVLTVTNTGTAPLLVSNVSGPPGFSLLDLPTLPVTVGAGQELVFRLQLDAAALGPVGGRVSVESDDLDEAVFDFPVRGTVVAPEIALHDGGPAAPEITDGQAGAVNFGTARQATPVVRSVLIANTGTAPLLVSGVTVPAGYTVLNASAAPFSVETGATLLLNVRLDASALGTFAGEVVITSDDLDEAVFNFPVTGTVVTPEVAVHEGTAAGPELTDGQTAKVDFGRNVQGTPGTRSFTVANTGTADLKVSGVTVPPGYTALNVPGLPFLIGINQSATFQVSLTTTDVGNHPGSVIVASDDLDEAVFDFPVTGEIFIPDPVSGVATANTTLNRQTGLREQTIHITNDTTATVPAYNLIIRGLPPGVEVNNASEIRPDGSVVVYIRQGMQPHSSQEIVIEYYSATRSSVEVSPQLSTEVVLSPPSLTAPAGETGLAIDTVKRLTGGDMLIEFTSIPGRRYQIQYSGDGQTWQNSLPQIRAAANRTQWIDRGLPRTDSHPAQANGRMYRVREVTP